MNLIDKNACVSPKNEDKGEQKVESCQINIIKCPDGLYKYIQSCLNQYLLLSILATLSGLFWLYSPQLSCFDSLSLFLFINPPYTQYLMAVMRPN